MMNLREIVQEVAGALNQSQPTSVVNNPLGDAPLWLRLAQREGRELSKRHDWRIVEHTWTTTATVAQALAFPSDYDHLPPDPEIWDRTGNRRLVGPTSSRDWQILNSTSVTASPGWWRIINGALNVYPAPSAGSTYALEYISKNWCESSGGTGQSSWQDDADVPRIPDDLIALGLTWRWLRAKGFDYAEEMSTYEREVEKATGRDRGSNIMVVGGASHEELSPATWSGTVT